MIEIQPETGADIPAIHTLTAAAFAPTPYSNGTEPAIIDALRSASSLSLSLVGLDGAELVGQISFSPVTIDGAHDHWFGLGPVAVLPERQSEGIGSQLVRTGLEAMKAQGAKGCVLVGPPDYYGRFGFVGNTGLDYNGIDRAYVQQLPFAAPQRAGQLVYCDAFERAAAG